MTIRRRLALSFLVILLLFGLNLVIYFWGNHRRKVSVEALQRAVDRQIRLATIDQKLNGVRKQVSLLSQLMVETGGGAADPREKAQFNRELDSIDRQIQEVQRLSEPKARAKADEFLTEYQKLAASWRIFYENFGVHHAQALTELAVRADPQSTLVLEQLLPPLKEPERRRVDEASANFYQVAALTDRIAIFSFVVSTLLAVGVAFSLSRHLTQGLSVLKVGALLIGGGTFNYRIPITSDDELGDLARAYNDMAENLHAARKEMTGANLEVERRATELEKQREMTESLLLNILPVQVAEELRLKGEVNPKYFEDVTIIFTDFVGFTLSTEKLAAEELVTRLHDYFTAFDQITARYHLEKLKTIGDSYMCVSGLPLGRRARRTPSHPVDAVLAAFEMVHAVTERDRPDEKVRWSVRVGIHTGPVIAGVVGIQKFAFDIWGDPVNFASRMESSGAPNRINVSERTYSRVKDFFECEYRGRVLTKDKKEADMYFVNGILAALADDGTQSPPPSFLRRYRVYFQKEPPAFPAFLLERAASSNSLT